MAILLIGGRSNEFYRYPPWRDRNPNVAARDELSEAALKWHRSLP